MKAASNEEQISSAFYEAMRALDACGKSPLPQHTDADGLARAEIGDWKLEVNPSDKQIKSVPPFGLLIFWKGWVAGLFTPYEGAMVAASAVNEDQFIQDMKGFADGALHCGD